MPPPPSSKEGLPLTPLPDLPPGASNPIAPPPLPHAALPEGPLQSSEPLPPLLPRKLEPLLVLLSLKVVTTPPLPLRLPLPFAPDLIDPVDAGISGSSSSSSLMKIDGMPWELPPLMLSFRPAVPLLLP